MALERSCYPWYWVLLGKSTITGDFYGAQWIILCDLVKVPSLWPLRTKTTVQKNSFDQNFQASSSIIVEIFMNFLKIFKRIISRSFFNRDAVYAVVTNVFQNAKVSLNGQILNHILIINSICKILYLHDELCWICWVWFLAKVYRQQ